MTTGSEISAKQALTLSIASPALAKNTGRFSSKPCWRWIFALFLGLLFCGRVDVHKSGYFTERKIAQAFRSQASRLSKQRWILRKCARIDGLLKTAFSRLNQGPNTKLSSKKNKHWLESYAAVFDVLSRLEKAGTDFGNGQRP